MIGVYFTPSLDIDMTIRQIGENLYKMVHYFSPYLQRKMTITKLR